MKFTIERNWIEVVGFLWMGGKASTGYDLNKSQVEIIGSPPTRKKVSQWLTVNSGDFQHIIDFRAIVGEKIIPWEKEENELFFQECSDGLFPG